MHIEIIEPRQEDVLHERHGEVWLKVQTKDLVDLPSVWEALTPAQVEQLRPCFPVHGPDMSKPPILCSYYPHRMTAEERAESGYDFEDWWVFPKTGGMKA